MMGFGRIEQIAELLLARGWNALTPAAVISGAGTPASSVWTVSLRELTHPTVTSRPTDSNAPATIVIGDVVRLGAILSAQADSDEAAAGGQ